MLRLVLLVLAVASAAHAAIWTPHVDLRVREEVLDGVYHFAPEDDRDWVRVRTRLGLAYDADDFHAEVRLDNEHRHMRTPTREPDFDEIILDRALFAWTPASGATLTFGRQDILWPGGFLVLEGHPLDGSRSMFHDGIRAQTRVDLWSIDAAVVRNRKRDGLVIADDLERALTDADETGAMLRLARGAWAASFVAKLESDPDEVLEDLGTVTLGLRYKNPSWHVEGAIQHQNGTVRAAANDGIDRGTGFAFAGEASRRWNVGGEWTLETAAYGYSGLDGEIRPFRTPWGRWPKWSEMYIYTLIGESTPGRVHVAAWEDIAAPRLALQRGFTTPWTSSLVLRGVADSLWSPSTGDARGLLTELGLKASFDHGLTAHLLWERLDPGAYHDGRHGLAAIDDPVQFFRWQLTWTW